MSQTKSRFNKKKNPKDKMVGTCGYITGFPVKILAVMKFGKENVYKVKFTYTSPEKETTTWNEYLTKNCIGDYQSLGV